MLSLLGITSADVFDPGSTVYTIQEVGDLLDINPEEVERLRDEALASLEDLAFND